MGGKTLWCHHLVPKPGKRELEVQKKEGGCELESEPKLERERVPELRWTIHQVSKEEKSLGQLALKRSGPQRREMANGGAFHVAIHLDLHTLDD